MGLNNRLQIGDVSNNGQVEIVDEGSVEKRWGNFLN